MSTLFSPTPFGVVHDGSLEKLVFQRRLVNVRVEHVSSDKTLVWLLDPTTNQPFSDYPHAFEVGPERTFLMQFALPLRPTNT